MIELRESRILAENHVLPRVLSRSEVNGCGSSGGRVHGETERPSDRATERPSDRGVLGKAWKRRMVEEGASTVFIDITSGSGPECAPSPIRGPLNSYSKK